MGYCSICGKPAGFLRKKHSECEVKRSYGWSQMLVLATDSALGRAPLSNLEERLTKVAKSNHVPISRVPRALVGGWEQAVDHFLEDGHLDPTEEEHLTRFRTDFSLTQDQLDVGGAYTRLVKGAVLRDILNGIMPDRVDVKGNLPFNFQQIEKLVWLFPAVKYFECRSRRQYVGGSHGMSFRIAKGVYYRVGAFKGHAIETTESVHIGTGLLGVTNRHIYFSCDCKSFRIRHDKIVSIAPYSDGVELHRDAATARPQSFVTGDGWFTYNLLKNVANLSTGR